jgi:hypothetical protein
MCAAQLDAYDPALAPAPFGQQNTGATCYWNSTLAALASCTAFTRAVLANESLLAHSRTGRAMHAYVRSYCEGLPPATGTTAVLHALVDDLRERSPTIVFGRGQESASEALVLLLDMMAPPRAPEALPPGVPASYDSPVTQLFIHRYLCTVHCLTCQNRVSTMSDYAVNFNLFDMDRRPPTTPAQFSEAVQNIYQELRDYRCPVCAAPTVAARHYRLAMIPEIMFCMFNLYEGFGGAHRARYFPPALRIPAIAGGDYEFRVVAQVEHWGGLGGGHYWARGLRAAPSLATSSSAASELTTSSQKLSVYQLNDMGVQPAQFAPSANTYIVVYNYAGTVAAQA